MPTTKPPRTPPTRPRASSKSGNKPDELAPRRRRATKLRAKAGEPTPRQGNAGEQTGVSGRDSRTSALSPAMRETLHVLPGRRQGQRPSESERTEAQRVFLEAFAEHANLTFAARAAGIDRNTVYDWQQQDEAFAAAFKAAEAEASDTIRKAIHDRAIVGWYEPVVSMGEVVRQDDGTPWVLHKYDSPLLQKLAAARLPEWRPQQDVTVNGGVRTEVVYVNDWRRAMQSGTVVPATLEDMTTAPMLPAPVEPAEPEPAEPEPQEPEPLMPTLGIEVVYASPTDEQD